MWWYQRECIYLQWRKGKKKKCWKEERKENEMPTGRTNLNRSFHVIYDEGGKASFLPILAQDSEIELSCESLCLGGGPLPKRHDSRWWVWGTNDANESFTPSQGERGFQKKLFLEPAFVITTHANSIILFLFLSSFISFSLPLHNGLHHLLPYCCPFLYWCRYLQRRGHRTIPRSHRRCCQALR